MLVIDSLLRECQFGLLRRIYGLTAEREYTQNQPGPNMRGRSVEYSVEGKMTCQAVTSSIDPTAAGQTLLK